MRPQEKLFSRPCYLSSSDVAGRLGLHVGTFQKYLREGRIPDFPNPRSVMTGKRLWLSTDVEEWMFNRPQLQDLA